MKTKIIILVGCLLLSEFSSAQLSKQKPLLTDMVDWESLGLYGISNDGKYIKYGVNGKLFLVSAQGKHLLNSEWVHNSFFTNDSRYFIFTKEEYVYLYSLESTKLDSVQGRQFVTIPAGIDKYICYKKEDGYRLRKLDSGKESILHCDAVESDPTGRYLLLKSALKLELLDMISLKTTTIISGENVTKTIFDKEANGLAFITKDSVQKKLMYYDVSKQALKKLVSLNDKSFKPGQDFAESFMSVSLGFTNGGKYVLFSVSKPQVEETADGENGASGIQVWNYKDKWLKGHGRSLDRATMLMSVSIDGNNLLQLESEETVLTRDAIGKKYVIVENYRSESIGYWHEAHKIQYQLVDLSTGQKKIIFPEVGPLSNRPPFFSPDEKFIIWFDYLAGHYFSYELATGIKRNISALISEPINGSEIDVPVAKVAAYTGGWDETGNRIIIYGKNDVWIADLFAQSKPVNITNGFGKKNNIKFQLVEDHNLGKTILPLRNADELLLAAFNYTNKQNGFWKIKIGSGKDPELLTMQDAAFYFWGVSGKSIVKAKNAQAFILTKQNADKSPNLFYTKDLKQFVQLSHIYPEKKYNWLTSRLITWNVDDTTRTSGILYLPENFDSTKKYPVLFYYYDRVSNGLHLFHEPGPSTAAINMPVYVSNGYLVFMPDIVYHGGHTAKSVTNTVVTAASHLKQYPWVDMKRLGLQGHSFGGYETNCIIANTTIFACAQEGAGVSNVSSCFSQPGFGEPTTFSGSPNAFLLENSQLNTQTTPWENPDIYVENSPVFQANKIETPLLIMHNKGDDIVSFMQAHEMYNALNRQRKKVWLLHYDGSGHTVNEGGLDFSRRQQQFFNHYLKGAPAPLWMLDEIPFSLQGKRSGLQLDTLNRIP